jgi:hypothetical protein
MSVSASSREENDNVDVRCGDGMVWARLSIRVVKDAEKKPRAHQRPIAKPDFQDIARKAAPNEMPIEKLMARRKAALFM